MRGFVAFCLASVVGVVVAFLAPDPWGWVGVGWNILLMLLAIKGMLVQMRGARWLPPEMSEGDALVEAEIVEPDGTRHPIVLLRHHVTETGGWVTGYSRPIELPPGAWIEVEL